MPGPDASQPIIELAQRRADARSAHDWATADRLRAEIEAAGWKVVDAGTDFRLTPMRPTDIVEADRTLYGSVDSVPSLAAEPDQPGATVVIASSPDTPASPALVTRLAATSPPDTSIVVVAPADVTWPRSVVGEVDGRTVETIWTVDPWTPGASVSAALRRATGSIIVVVSAAAKLSGDVVTPLARALSDQGVGVAGHPGLRSADLLRFHPAPLGEVTAVGPDVYAFRRTDALARGPLDGRLNLPGGVATWWSLVLRDSGPDAPPRTALAMDLPLVSQPSPDPNETRESSRAARRDAYRIAAAFRDRPDLGHPAPISQDAEVTPA